RKTGRTVRFASRPLRRLRLARPAVSRLGGSATRDRNENAGFTRRCDRRQRVGRGLFRTQVPPGVGKGGGAWSSAVHSPQSTPDLARRFKGNGWLANTIGNPLDTTIALQHLIFEGTLDRFPGLKIIAAHGGGYLASYAARSDHACFVSPQNCN